MTFWPTPLVNLIEFVITDRLESYIGCVFLHVKEFCFQFNCTIIFK